MGIYASVRRATILSCLIASAACAQTGVTLGFTPTGLTSLQYGGTQFLSDGTFHLNQITFQNADGSTFAGSTAGTATINTAAQTETIAYSWGTIVNSYVVTGNRLNLTVTASNQSSAAISEIWFQPISLILPSQAQEYNGVTPLLVNTIGQPAIQTLTYTGGALAISADDVALPLQLGFPYASNRPTSTIFPLMLNTGSVSSDTYPTSLPVISRPIAAGATDEYHFSIRFGGTGSTRYTLAPDTFQAFAYAFPSTLSFPDHRSIGSLIISTPGLGAPTNPRGWFNDPTVDVTTPAGLATFRTRLLSWAQYSIGVLQSMNAQGMVTWDIEGQQFPQPTSYVCDPTVFAQTAPEMAQVADDYFQMFLNAGLRTGVCIRPQQFVLSADGSSAQQVYLTDPNQILQTLIEKASYARDRWGATLFYIDSNVQSLGGNPLDPSIFASLQAAFPDSLFFPEHSETQYWAYSAPYLQLNQGYDTTPPDASFTYPNSFTLINTADGPIQQDFPILVQSVNSGDLLMYRAWYDDEPAHSLIQSIYRSASTPGVSVLVSPQTAALGPGQSTQLSSFVIGSSNQATTWTVPTLLGTVTSNGLYSAPATITSQQNVNVVATSVADATKFASATITLWPPGVAATVSASAGSGQSAVVGSSFGSVLQAQVTDILNNPVSGVSVTFTVPSKSASFAGALSAVAITNSNGVAQSPTLTAGTLAGAYNATASAPGANTSATFSLSNQVGPVAAIVATTGSGQSTPINSAFASPLRATVTDVDGNPLSGVAVTFTAPATGASASFNGVASVVIMTGLNGVAAVSAVANGLAGSYAITATATGAVSPATFTMQNAAATSSGGVLSGVASSSSAAVNLTTEGATDWVHWESGYQDRKTGVAAQITGYTATTGTTVQAYANDPRAISWTDGNPRTSVSNDVGGVYVGGLQSGFSLTVAADTTPRTLVVHAGGYNSGAVLTASLSDGSAPVYLDNAPFVSTQYDRDYTITYHAASTGQLLTVSWVLVSGGGNVTLSAAALSGMSIIATAGTPQTAAAGTTFNTPLQVTVTNASGNPLSGVTVNFTAPGTGASATFGKSATASVVTNSNGVAVAPALTANAQTGAYTVTASVAGITAASAAFLLTNAAGPPATLTVISGTPQSTSVNSAFVTPLSVSVTDANNNPVPGATIAFAVVAANGASASFGGSSSVNVATYNKGIATAPSLIANGQGGTYTVLASVTGVTPVSFSLTNVAKSAATITATSGTPQSAIVNQAFPNLLMATVVDSKNNPVSGVTVTFTVPATGASASFGGSATSVAITNIYGIAISTQLTANGLTGSYVVTASAAGVASPASFSLTNNPIPPSGTLTGSGTSSQALANLTSEGSVDWVHWGDGPLNRKAGVTAQISTYSVVGSGSIPTYNNDPRPLSWSDGSPTASSSSNTNGIYINSLNNGFLISAPADTTMRKLTVHVGGWLSGGTLTAHLSDASAADFVDVTSPTGGQYDRNYTLIYSAVSSGQTLTVKWVMTSGQGNVTLNAAALSLAGPTITATAGTPQSAAIGSAFATPLQVTVVNASGSPLANATVTFTAPTTGAGATFAGLSSTTATTNSNGVATAPALTANGQTGSYTISASTPGALPVSFSLNNTAGPAASIAATAGSAQSTAVNTSFATLLQATVTDSGNNPVSGITVTFTAPASGATASFGGSATATAVTNASGVATASALTANAQTGSYSVTASVASLHSSATFSLTNISGPPSSISASAGSGQSVTVNGTFTTPLQAVVKDAGGNLLSGVQVTFTAPGSGPSAAFGASGSSVTASTNASGVATAPALTANAQAGSYIVTASVSGVASPASFSLTNLAGPPASIAATAGTPQSTTAGTAFSSALQVTVRDAGSNPVSGVTVTFTAPAAGPSGTFGGLSVITAVTNSNGVATAPTLTANSQFGSYSVVASVSGTSATASFALTNSNPVQSVPAALVQQAAAANLGNNQDTLSVTLANAPKSSDVLILFFDQVGAAQTITSISGATWTKLAQNYTSSSGDFEIWAGTNPVSSTVTITGTNYFGGFQPGYAIVAEFAGVSASLDGTAVLTTGGIWPATTGKLITSNASDLLLCATMSYNGGGVDASVSAPWTALAAPGGTYSLSAAYQIVNAAGSFAASWNGYGTPQVPTIVLGLKTAGQVVQSGPPASITASAGSGQSTATSTAFATALQATVKDANNNPISGVLVTFTAPASGASGTFSGSPTATATTNTNGVATAPTLTANAQAGPYTVSATVAGVTGSAGFTLTNTSVVGIPASITAAAGTPQSATISTAFGTALQALVKDANNTPISGLTVTFSAPGSGAGASFSGLATATATTNASGIATAPALTANSQAGSYTVTASVTGLAATASYNLSNIAGSAASISVTAGSAQSAAVNSAFATALQATVKDANNNPVSGASVTFTAPATGPSAAFAGSTTFVTTTNASGVATATTLTANGQTGSYSVLANVTGATTPASFALTNTSAVAATIQLVQQGTGVNLGNNQNTLTVTLPNAPKSTDTLILFFDHVDAQQTITGITGATWTQLARNQTSNSGDSEIWVGTSPTSSTYTLTGTNYFGGFQPGYAIVAEFSGVTTILDGAPQFTTSGIWPVTTGVLSTTNPGDLLLTATLSYNGGGTNASVSSPWTLLTAPGGTYSLSAAYRIVNTAGSYAATWNGAGSPQVATIVLALK